MPEVSIIMPVFNKVSYLSQTFEALLAMSYQDWELIVVDDGSDDGSAEIISEFERKEERIRCISQKNEGVSSARNCGLFQAGGEWIWFLDADDLPNADFLQLLFSDADHANTDILIGTFQRLKGNGRIQNVQTAEYGLCREEQLPDLFMKYQYRNGFWGYVWNKVIRRSVLAKEGIQFAEDWTVAEDLKFMLSLYRRGSRIEIVPYCAVRYREDAEHTSGERKTDYLQQLSLQMDVKEWIVDCCGRTTYSTDFCRRISRYAAIVVFDSWERGKDPVFIAKKLAGNPKLSGILDAKGLDVTKKIIVCCLIHKQYVLLKIFLSVRTKTRSCYRKIIGIKGKRWDRLD